jgi:hypothetical protein
MDLVWSLVFGFRFLQKPKAQSPKPLINVSRTGSAYVPPSVRTSYALSVADRG